MRVLRDARSNPGESVPCLIGDHAPLSPAESVVVALIDGLRSVDEIASASGATDVRALLVELLWQRDVVLEEGTTGDDIDVFDEFEEPELIPLRRRRSNEDSPLVRAVLAWVACIG